MRKPQRPPLPKRTSINLEPYLAKLESLRDRDTGWAAMSASKLAEFLLVLGLDVSEQASMRSNSSKVANVPVRRIWMRSPEITN